MSDFTNWSSPSLYDIICARKGMSRKKPIPSVPIQNWNYNSFVRFRFRIENIQLRRLLGHIKVIRNSCFFPNFHSTHAPKENSKRKFKSIWENEQHVCIYGKIEKNLILSRDYFLKSPGWYTACVL